MRMSAINEVGASQEMDPLFSYEEGTHRFPFNQAKSAYNYHS